MLAGCTIYSFDKSTKGTKKGAARIFANLLSKNLGSWDY